jgi:tryptophanyl-tRNA synthetase
LFGDPDAQLGNYLGFIKPLLKLQRTASPKTPIYLCIADLHAISIYREPEQLLHDRRDILAVMIAAGIDPERTCLYFQGDVSVVNDGLRHVFI